MQDSYTYALGKLPQADLLRLLSHTQAELDPQVILGPGLGRDAAVVDFGDRYLVVKTDPITFATDEIGWYAVNVNANDVACVGARPRWFIASLLLPEHRTSPAMVETIFEQLHQACRELGAIVVGGHTEITYGIERPIVVGTMLGEVRPEDLVRSDGARPGDTLLLTKGIAIEGTAILAKEKRAMLLERGLPTTLVDRAADFLHHPGISIVRDARIITSVGEVHAMHDPTEGGVATGIAEITEAAGVGAILSAQALHALPETEAICQVLGLDALGVIASGALLAAVAKQDADPILSALNANGIPAAAIGTVTAAQGVTVRDGDELRVMPKFARDEIARLFESQQ